MSTYTAVDLFAGGGGGWDLAAQSLGLTTLGFENDADSVATRMASFLDTAAHDVRTYSPVAYNYGDAPGIIASPPCQSYSRAGKGRGREQLDNVLFGLNAMLAGQRILNFEDDNTGLVLEPLRWILTREESSHPVQWVAMEQVPSVLPVWEGYADALKVLGFDALATMVNSEQYGTAQTRKRAILLARRNGPVGLPLPTHQKYVYGQPAQDDGVVKPWVSMRKALGVDSLPVNNQSGTEFDYDWQLDQPAQVVAGRKLIPFRGANANRFNGSTKSRNDGFKVTIEQMAALQGFPAGYPWHGTESSKALQVGNAIPVPLAKALLSAVVD